MDPPQVPRRFHLFRKVDVTGVSGPGVIAEGVEFTDGTAIFMWLSDRASLTIFPKGEGGMQGILEKHGHNGQTVVVWLDPKTETQGC